MVEAEGGGRSGGGRSTETVPGAVFASWEERGGSKDGNGWDKGGRALKAREDEHNLSPERAKVVIAGQTKSGGKEQTEGPETHEAVGMKQGGEGATQRREEIEGAGQGD